MLEENVKTELDDNPGLDNDTGDDSAEREDAPTPKPEEESFEQTEEREERQVDTLRVQLGELDLDEHRQLIIIFC